MSTMLDHEHYMRRAIELARKNPQAPFAALLVEGATGTVWAEGLNRTQDGPIWHGEIDVLERCARAHPGIDWTGLVLYTTAEPCPMCMSAITWARIGVLGFGTSIRTLQRLGWAQIDILAEEVAARAPFHKCQLLGGLLEMECDALFQAAVARQFASRPA
jgi:tRNA(adenine34) deaminase